MGRLSHYMLATVVVLTAANLIVWPIAFNQHAQPQPQIVTTSDARLVCKHDIQAAIAHANSYHLKQMDLPKSCYTVLKDVQPIFDELHASGIGLAS